MKSEKLYLIHMVEAATRIKKYTEPGKQAFLNDQMMQDAVIKVLANLTESADNIISSTKADYPHIPWHTVKAFRNVLVHDYLGDLELEELWKIIHDDLPELMAVVRKILKEKYEIDL